MKRRSDYEPKHDGLTLIEIIDRFRTDEQARAHLEEIRWGNGIVCPKCKCSDQSKFSSIKANPKTKVRAGLRYCAECKRQFTVTVGTIFEDSHIPLSKWLVAWYLLCSSKKGISSLQLHRMLGFGSYRSALFMMHRIRYALLQPIFSEKLSGTIEADETYVGGKQTGRGHARAFENKTPVVALVQRGGPVRARVMKRPTGENLKKLIRDNVLICSEVHTDENQGYVGLEPKYRHRPVKHSVKEYARRDPDGMIVHCNSAECFFSLVKRGIFGTFHNVSRKHLPLYIAEFQHRWNHRRECDGDRTLAALRMAEGKRLTMKPLRGN